MADPAGFPLHQARFADATKIPMTPFGVEMLVMMYLIALLAYVTYGLRMYSKITSKQTGIGKDGFADMNYGALRFAVLITGPFYRGLVHDGRHGSPPFCPTKVARFSPLAIAQIFSIALMVASYWCTFALL